MEAIAPSVIDWGVAAAALPGEPHSGDLHVVKPFPGGLLIAALDGLGHGEEAAAAARTASAILEKNAAKPVIALVQQCHQELRGSRGVVMSLAAFNLNHGLMTWVGVGNVNGVLLRYGAGLLPVEESLLLRAGVVGSHLPPLQAAVLPVSHSDTLIFATDGVQNDFTRQLVQNQTPQKAAKEILERHGKTTDDALVLVARYFGIVHERTEDHANEHGK